MEKVTLVLGASPNPDRFSYKAIRRLQEKKIPVLAVGRKDENIGSLKIRKGMPDDIGTVHTITLYMSPANQKEYYNYILSLNPKRIIFNPGTMNPELAGIARKAGVEVVDECMLVMLTTGTF
jgi:predicted CoA-binding protein